MIQKEELVDLKILENKTCYIRIILYKTQYMR